MQDKIHDLQKHAEPMLTLYDAEGRELAANDDFYFADPLLSYTFPKTGNYFLQVRESNYDGDPRWVYALLATNKPYVSHVFPMAGNPGKTIEVEPVGSAKFAKDEVALHGPRRRSACSRSSSTSTASRPTRSRSSSARCRSSSSTSRTTRRRRPTRITLPGGINGRIGKKRDLDHFVFTAKKGKAIRFEVKARRFGTLLNSGLHGILDVMTPKGARAGQQRRHHRQGRGAGLHAAGRRRLRPAHPRPEQQGRRTSVYYLESDWALPDFTLRCDRDKAMIGPGSQHRLVRPGRRARTASPARCKVEVKGLPQGVTVNPLTIPATHDAGRAGADRRRRRNADGGRRRAGDRHGEGQDRTARTRRSSGCVTPNQEIYSPAAAAAGST